MIGLGSMLGCASGFRYRLRGCLAAWASKPLVDNGHRGPTKGEKDDHRARRTDPDGAEGVDGQVARRNRQKHAAGAFAADRKGRPGGRPSPVLSGSVQPTLFLSEPRPEVVRGGRARAG